MAVKQIYIADSYSLNTGDIGILLATMSAIKNEFGKIRFIVEASHPEKLQKITSVRSEVYPRIFDISHADAMQPNPWNKIVAIIVGAFDSSTFLLFAILARHNLPSLWALRPARRKQARSILRSDFWLSSGGGYLSSLYHFQFRLLGYLVAFILRKPVIIFAQSVGPFNKTWHKNLAKFFLDRVRLITLREPDSVQYVQKLCLTRSIYETADIAFLLPVKNVKGNGRDKKVAICIRRSSEKYSQTLIQYSSNLLMRGYKVVIVSHTPGDDETAAYIASKTDGASVRCFGESPIALKEFYATCELVVASRMHALIFASEQGVPWIGLMYEPKFIGLGKQLEGFGFIVEEEKISVKILEALSKKASSIENYADCVQLRVIRSKARRNVQMLHRFLGQET